MDAARRETTTVGVVYLPRVVTADSSNRESPLAADLRVANIATPVAIAFVAASGDGLPGDQADVEPLQSGVYL